ncbi:MAG: ABC transporter permease, partial [Saprospiraceae bacterium]|nr:ABC transporter permease [Saprospiraceae bacterium]
MFRNHLKIAFRNFLKHKQNTVINLGGLTLGLACCLVLFYMVQFELRFDSSHKKADRIYRVNMHLVSPNKAVFTNGSSYGLPQLLLDQYPDLFHNEEGQPQTTLFKYLEFGQVDVMEENQEDRSFREEWIAFAQPSFFHLFDIEWLAGNQADALAAPNTTIISESLAKKYFGNLANTPSQVIGKALRLIDQGGIQASGLDQGLEVVGVFKDLPSNSSLRMKMLVSFKTIEELQKPNMNSIQYAGMFVKNYIALPENYDPKTLEDQFPDLIQKHLGEDWVDKRRIVLQAFRDIHFNTDYNNPAVNKQNILALGWVGLLLLMVSCINYVNLSIAIAASRSKEMVMRKILGSSRKVLINGAMIETAMMVLLAILLAVGVAEILLRQLTEVLVYPAPFALLGVPGFFLFLTGVFFFCLFLNGLYPALFLSRFKPIQYLSSSLNLRLVGNLSMRRVLLLVQFTIAQGIIIAALVITKQVNFGLHKDLGFTKDAVITMDLPVKDSVALSRFKEQLSASPQIQSISYSTNAPMSDRHWRGSFAYKSDKVDLEEVAAEYKYGDEHYLETYGFELLAGKYFESERPLPRVVVNEALLDAIQIEDPADAIGETLNMPFWERKIEIIGVVKNFHLTTIHHNIEPCLIFCEPRRPKAIVAVKLEGRSPQEIKSAISATSESWGQAFPGFVFNYQFLDQQLANFYESETRSAFLFKAFSIIAILISALGL